MVRLKAGSNRPTSRHSFNSDRKPKPMQMRDGYTTATRARGSWIRMSSPPPSRRTGMPTTSFMFTTPITDIASSIALTVIAQAPTAVCARSIEQGQSHLFVLASSGEQFFTLVAVPTICRNDAQFLSAIQIPHVPPQHFVSHCLYSMLMASGHFPTYLRWRAPVARNCWR